MCLLAYKPAGAVFDREMLEKGAATNSDGWGFAALSKQGIYVEKGLDFDKDRTVADWGENTTPIDVMEMMKDYEMIVHFRKVSSGDKSIQNVHPIHVGYGDTWIAHNGTMTGMTVKDDPISDTAHFGYWVGLFLANSKGVLQTDKKFWAQMEWLAGTQNKIAIVRPLAEGGITILNRSAGWELTDGIWVSNKLWEWPGRRWNEAYPYNLVLEDDDSRPICGVCGACGHSNCVRNLNIKCTINDNNRGYHLARECTLSAWHAQNCQGLIESVKWGEDIVCLTCHQLLSSAGEKGSLGIFIPIMLPGTGVDTKDNERWGIKNCKTGKFTQLKGTYKEMSKMSEKLNKPAISLTS